MNNINDFAEHLWVTRLDGRTLEESLSRAVYKGTDCGAWLEVIEPGYYATGKRSTVWTATINRSILGGVVVAIRQKGRKTMTLYDHKTGENPWPKTVKDYLLADDRGVMRLDPEDGLGNAREVRELLNSLKVGDDTLRVTRRCLQVIVTFKVGMPVLKAHNGGIRIGTIVEGSDVEPLVQPVELYFPFTPQKWGETVGDIESEATYWWNEVNQPEEETPCE